MISDILEEIGFSRQEVETYLKVLEMGEASFSVISRRTGIKRGSTYNIIDSLKQRDVVNVTKKNNVQVVSAVSPRVLIDRISKNAQNAQSILPDLMDLHHSSVLKPRLRFFEGKDGVKKMLTEFSFSSGESYGFTDYDNMPVEIFEYIRTNVVPERRKNENYLKLIAPANQINIDIQNSDDKKYTTHKIVNFEENNAPMELLLFGEANIAFLSFLPSEMFGVIIESPGMYKTLKNIFLMIWNSNS